ATDAERGDAPLLPGVLQRLEQGDEHPGARGTDGVTERGRATADVHLVRVELEDLVVGDSDDGEGLVDLPEVDVGGGGLGPLEELPDRVGGGDGELHRLPGRGGVAGDAGEDGL